MAKIPFAWLLANCLHRLDPQSVAGLMRWDEDHLQVKTPIRHPLSEEWWDPGDQSLWCQHNSTVHPACPSMSTMLEASCSRSGRLQSTRSVQTSWPRAEVRHFSLIFLHAEASRRWVKSLLKVSQAAGSENRLYSATIYTSTYLNLQIQDFRQGRFDVSWLSWECGPGATWVTWCFGRSLTVCVWIVPTQ